MTSIDPRLRKVALLVAGCFFMEILDATIVVTAIPRISSSLDADPNATSLIISAYLVTLAVLIPLSSWMTRRFGYRRVFLSAIAIFTLASLGCAASQTLGELVALRIVQGVGGAMMVPVGRMVVLDRAAKTQILRLMSFVVWPGLIAPVIAPLAGGVITTYASWRWLFLVNIPLGGLALLVAWRLIEGRPGEAVAPLDRRGVLLTCCGLGALTYTARLISDPAPDWTLVAALSAGSALSLAGAARHLLRAEAPLVNLRTLEIPTFGTAMSGSSLFWLVVGAIPFLLPLFFQTVFDWSPIKSGAVVLFVFVGNVAIKPSTRPLLRRFGFRRVILAAAGGLALTTAACGLVTAATPLAVIIVLVLVSGAARSVGLTGYTTLALSDVPQEQMRDANALAATVQQLCSGLGVAAATVALRVGDPLGALLPGREGASAPYTVAFGLLAVVALAAAADGLRIHHAAGDVVAGRTAPSPAGPTTRPEAQPEQV
jgi:EmrB/QacA subfamily drug resistance transporter